MERFDWSTGIDLPIGKATSMRCVTVCVCDYHGIGAPSSQHDSIFSFCLLIHSSDHLHGPGFSINFNHLKYINSLFYINFSNDVEKHRH